MPNWKKVIVSGSSAALTSVTATAGFTGSLLGTASTASFVTGSNVYGPYGSNSVISASYAANGGVTQLLAGPNITLSPTTGKGQVTISSTGGGGPFFNTATGSYGSFYDTTTQTNPVGNVPRSMSFNTTDITNGVSISGSTSPFNTYIKTENPGVYDIQFSAQLDKTDAGKDEIVIWLRKNGIDLTDTATSVSLTNNNDKVVAAWNWFVNSAANDYYQIIWYSADTDLRLLAETAGGGHPGIPSVIATVNRVDQFLSNTGSFSGSFTGTLLGTASYATQALSASHATSTAAVAGTTNYVPKFTSGTTLGNSQIFDDGTDVSIGTSTYISGSVFWGPSADYGILSVGISEAYIYGNIGKSLSLGGNGSVDMLYISASTGNVGINTITPSYKLDVAAAGISDGIRLSNGGIDRFILDGSGILTWGSASNAGLLSWGTSEAYVYGNIGKSLSLGAGGSVDMLYISASTGNVGIGTTTPGVKFVNSGAPNQSSPTLGSGIVGSQALLSNNGLYGMYSGVSNTGDVWHQVQRNDAGSTTYNLLFNPSGGNVGIGTITPAYTLSIVGKIALNSGAGNDIFIGDNAGQLDDGTNNVNLAIGINASQNNISGSQNVAIGNNALQFNTSINNTAVGSNASRYNTSGDSNTSLGSYAMWQTIDGRNNTGIGAAALLFNTSGSSNTSVGSSSLRNNTSGSGNVGVGLSALNPNTIGNDNIAIGRNSGRYYGSTGTNALTNTSASIFIGDTTRANNLNETNQIVIGVGALGLGSNSVVLGNDNVITTALKGNVGIGTTTPGYKLNLYSTSSTQPSIVGTNIFPVAMCVGHGYDIASPNNITAKIEFTPSAPAGFYGDDITFSTTALTTVPSITDASTEKMRITRIGTVGIGAPNPASTYRLTIDGAGTSGDPLGGITFRQGGTDTLYFGNVSTANTTDWEMWNPRNGYMRFATNNTERIRIASNGSIQFNTYGSGTFTGTATQKLAVDNLGNIIEIPIGSGPVDGSGTANYITRWSDSDTITTSSIYETGGNIGIGTTSPNGKLDVVGNAYFGTFLNTDIKYSFVSSGSLSSYHTYINNSNSAGGTYGLGVNSANTSTNGYILGLSSGGTERMIVRNDGNVGIGTSTPSAKIDTNGSIASNGGLINTSTRPAVNSGTLTNGELRGYSNTGTGADDGFIRLSAGGGTNASTKSYIDISGYSTVSDMNKNIVFGTEGAEKMRITLAGDVGIGTSNPGYKLDVNGDTNVTGTLTATVKSFIIDHPTKEGKKLQYGVLEGPEHSVYVRGKLTNTNVIQLPDYWHALVHEDSITVNLTAIGKPQEIWVEEITDTYITVGSSNETVNCFYTVFAERKDIDKLVTEFDKE